MKSTLLKEIIKDADARPDQKAAILNILNDKAATGPLLVKQADAAKLLSLSRVSIYRLVKAGVLHPVKIGGVMRYRMDELKAIASGGAR